MPGIQRKDDGIGTWSNESCKVGKIFIGESGPKGTHTICKYFAVAFKMHRLCWVLLTIKI